MKKITSFIVTALTLSSCSSSKIKETPVVKKWTGFEIMGQKNVKRDEIIKEIPIKIGAVYNFEELDKEKICDQIKKKFSFHLARCSAMSFSDGRSYFVLDVIEEQDKKNIKYRKLNKTKISLADEEVLNLYTRLMDRWWSLFKMGKPPMEKYNGDFLDYKDSKMHSLALQLSKKVPKYRENIIEVIKGHKDPKSRAKAAWLLCWAGHPKDSIFQVYKYMNDPDIIVRNDIIRFMGHWITRVKENGLQRKILDKLAAQIYYPSHADRNKALWTIKKIIEKFPNQKKYIRIKYKDRIDYVAKTSVLENVGGFAKEILRKIESK